MLTELLSRHPLVLAECAITERLRRHPDVELHPILFNTPLIYGPEPAREVMTSLYREYLAAADAVSLPLLLTAPTWRMDPDRVAAAEVPATINTDAVAYLRGVAEAYAGVSPVEVGALVGPRGDCYCAEEALDTEAAERFHGRQIGELAGTEASFLLAQTLPAVSEALGIAHAMAATGKPYLISFCAGPDGRILDGTRLPEAMERMDQMLERPPIGYMVNCTHPGFLTRNYAAGELGRLIGIQANGSSKDVTQLEASCATEADPVDAWAEAMRELHRVHEVPVLGGCCGTGLEHLQRLGSFSG